MSFDQLFVIAIAITTGVSLSTAVIAWRELRSRKAQVRTGYVVTAVSGPVEDEDNRSVGQNSELLHAISRLG